ncbi:MAG: MarR family transcriptional regulator [Bacillota bacterium]|jgi:MarR family transcriptional regulator, organic hydroperoxide resistance regulator
MTENSLDPRVRDIDYLLRHTSMIVRRHGREILSHFDITPPQFNALITIIRHDNLTMGTLCRHLFLASSTVTDLIDRMERNELVRRVRDERDRRVIRLQARRKGRDLLEKVMEARLEYLSEILQYFSDDEIDSLEHSLGALYQLMTERDEKIERQAAKPVTDESGSDR